MNLGYYYFDIFMRLMPQKELTYVQLQSAPRQDLDDVANRVEKLKQMLDTGIITEEDFTTQKNRILNSI